MTNNNYYAKQRWEQGYAEGLAKRKNREGLNGRHREGHKTRIEKTTLIKIGKETKIETIFKLIDIKGQFQKVVHYT